MAKTQKSAFPAGDWDIEQKATELQGAGLIGCALGILRSVRRNQGRTSVIFYEGPKGQSTTTPPMTVSEVAAFLAGFEAGAKSNKEAV